MDLVTGQAMVLGAAAATNLAHGALTGLVAGQIHSARVVALGGPVRGVVGAELRGGAVDAVAARMTPARVPPTTCPHCGTPRRCCAKGAR